MKFLRNMPKEKIQQLVLVAIFTLIGVSAMMVFWISGLKSELTNSSGKIKGLEPQIEDIERKMKADALNEPLRRQLVSFVETQRASMATGDLFAWAVREMTLFAERHPVRMTSVRPGMSTTHPIFSNHEVYTFHLELQGAYDAIGRFIREFENTFPTAQIRSMELSTTDSSAPTRIAHIEVAFLIWPSTATTLLTPKPTAELKKTP